MASRRSMGWRMAGLGVVATVGACAPESSKVVLSVFAASSLTEPFEEFEHQFEQSHPAVDVRLTFAGSQVLRLQIEQGAAADVFASANEAHMEALADAGVVGTADAFADNELVVVVPGQNPAGIESFAQLDRASRLVIGTDTVPVGAYTRQMLARAERAQGAEFVAQVESSVVSQESNVRLVRAKVELGEADAAVVYRTDAVASDRVVAVPIPPSVNVSVSYQIAPTVNSPHASEAAAFIAYVRSPAGRATLARHGFRAEAP